MKIRAFLCKSPIGIFAFSESGELVYYRLFSSAEKALEEFERDDFHSELEPFEIIKGSGGCRFLRNNLRDFAVSLGFSAGNAELTGFLSDFAAAMSRKRMKSLISRDRLLIQASNALEDLVKIHNSLLERLREWYLLHYPELKKTDITETVAKHGRRENMPDFTESAGVDIQESDENIFMEFSSLILAVENQQKSLRKYIELEIREIAPNLSALIEPLLVARFLALSGSLERLAKMPSSTIQLLGAEKALFRHLRHQGKSPKFGIIFLDPRIQNSGSEKRGKIARLLSSKLMLAARIDFYSKRDESAKLKKELEEELVRA